MKNPEYLSNLDNVNHSGSSFDPSKSLVFNGKTFCAPSSVSWKVLLMLFPMLEKKDEALFVKLLPPVLEFLQSDKNWALFASVISTS